MTDNPKPNPTVAPSDDENAESRMRLALGLRGAASTAGHAPQQRADQARARHKFVQDGGVPVVMLNRSHDQDALGALKARVAELERQLDHERTAHATTRRQVAEAQASLQHEKTRLAHAELAHQDALAAAARALEAAQATPIAAAIHSPAATPDAVRPKRGRPPRKPAIDRGLDRPSTSDKPVRWWTPSYRAKSG